MARPLAEVSASELWRGQLWEELQQLQMQERIASVEEKLNAIGEADKRVQLLRTIPGVGPRLAEAIVALLDQPQRFRNASQVSGYIGMVPKAFDSGESERRGHITRQGSGLVRSLLVEVAWAGLRHNRWMRKIYQRLKRFCVTSTSRPASFLEGCARTVAARFSVVKGNKSKSQTTGLEESSSLFMRRGSVIGDRFDSLS